MAEPRILHINDQFRWGGGEAQTWLLIRELERLGSENHALVCTGGPLAARLAGVLPAERLHRLARPLWALLPLVLTTQGLRSCKVLHAHTGRATLAFQALPATAVVKVAHRRIPDAPSAGGRQRLARADVVLCVSEEIRRRLAASGLGASGRPRLETVYSSAEALSLPATPLSLPGQPMLGYLGWFRRHKGLDLLLEALPAVRQRHPDLHLHLVGAGDEESALREQVHRLGLESCVSFHPFQDQPGPWLAALDLFILPSREEGLGSVALQAQALGVPVLGTRCGGLPEGVAHDRTGWLVEAESVPALSAGLCHALADPARLRAWGAAGPAWVEAGFSPAAMAKRTLAIYRELGA